MSHNILVGKRGIIFGALDDQSIAWKTAESVKNSDVEKLGSKIVNIRTKIING